MQWKLIIIDPTHYKSTGLVVCHKWPILMFDQPLLKNGLEHQNEIQPITHAPTLRARPARAKSPAHKSETAAMCVCAATCGTGHRCRALAALAGAAASRRAAIHRPRLLTMTMPPLVRRMADAAYVYERSGVSAVV